MVILQAFLAPISYRAVISGWLNSKFENESNKTSIGGIVGWMIGYFPWKYRFLHSVEPELSESFEKLLASPGIFYLKNATCREILSRVASQY